MQTIRQQTQLRSPLVVAAERGLAKPRARIKRQPAPPISFLIDGTACTDDVLKFPRTMREACGRDYAPLRADVSFLDGIGNGWWGLALAAGALAFFVGWSVQ